MFNKEVQYRIMFGLTRKAFTGSSSFSGTLTGKSKVSNWVTCISLNGQTCLIRATLIGLNLNELKYGLLICIVNLDRCNGSRIVLDDLLTRKCLPNKTEDIHLNVLNMITGKNKSKKLSTHISCDCKFKFHGKNCDL